MKNSLIFCFITVIMVSGCKPTNDSKQSTGSKAENYDASNTSSEFDGVYDALPFTCMGYCPVYMLIEDGAISLYNTDHQTLDHAGTINREHWWNIWKNKPILVSRYDHGITMQIAGVESFIALPDLEMTPVEFKNLHVSTENTLDDFLLFMEDPALVMGAGRNEGWDQLRLVHEGFCRSRINELFDTHLSYTNGFITIAMTYTDEKSTKIKASKEKIQAKFYFISPDNTVVSLSSFSGGDANTIELSKDDVLEYQYDMTYLDGFSEYPYVISDHFQPNVEYGIFCLLQFSFPADEIYSPYLRAVINNTSNQVSEVIRQPEN